jgi:AraC-like DNA-binding protein
MVKHTNITDTSLEEASRWGNAEYMAEGLVLTDRISDAPIPTDPTRLNFILMALCRKGRAQYSIDTREQQVLPGDLLFVSEGHIVDNYMASPDFECLCIMVSTEFYHGFVQNVKNVSSLLLFSTNNPVVALTPRECQVYTNYYQTIREKMGNAGHHYRTELVKALLLAMFYDMSNVIWRVEQSDIKTKKRADELFAQFIRLLEENFRTERRVSWYADQMNITAKYLSEMVKQVSKRTPNEWIDSYVMLEIRVLLKNTTKSIKEIAQAVNFPNQSFFGKFFKEHMGISPSEYRKVDN